MVAAYKRKAGAIMSAQLLDYSLHKDKKPRSISPAQKAGLAYEASVYANLLMDLNDCTFHPAFKFRSRAFDEYCIPDAMAFNDRRDIVTIIEIKLTHNDHGWMQLNNLYRPVVKMIWPEKHINLLEICKNYNAGTNLPGAISLVDDLEPWLEIAQQEYGIYPWSGP